MHYRSAKVLARFLNGQIVRAVWVQMERDDGSLRQQRLILSTDMSLSPARIIMAYGRRWSIEDMFNQLKNRWGWKDTWQQTRQVLHRWVQILSTAYALPQLLAHMGGHEVQKLASFSPWRAKQQITAGLVRQGLERFFRQVDIRALWNPKSQIFGPENYSGNPNNPESS